MVNIEEGGRHHHHHEQRDQGVEQQEPGGHRLAGHHWLAAVQRLQLWRDPAEDLVAVVGVAAAVEDPRVVPPVLRLPRPPDGLVVAARPVPADLVSVAQVAQTLLAQHRHPTRVVGPSLVGPDGVAEIFHRFLILRLVVTLAVLRVGALTLLVNNTFDRLLLRHNSTISEG